MTWTALWRSIVTNRERIDYLLSLRLWLTPGMGVKRHVMVAVVGTMALIIGAVAGLLWLLAENRQVLSDPVETVLISPFWRLGGGWISLALVLFGSGTAVLAVGRLNRSLLSNWLPAPHRAAAVLHRRLLLAKGPAIVAIGGGTGLSNLLRGLREHTSNLTAVVTVSDDGGSSGRLREAFDMPAPGDLSDCLAALSDNELEVSRLLEYRFLRGEELEGHTFGNLLITTLTEVEGDFGKAVRVLNGLLNLAGSVFPVTAQAVTLVVTKKSGEAVRGETDARRRQGAIATVAIEPKDVTPLPEVVAAIEQADTIVLGPGSLFTSTIPPLMALAAGAAIRSSQARLVYVCNIMTEAGETDGFSSFDHVASLHQHLGRYPDVVVINSTRLDERRRDAYRREKAEVVHFDVSPFQQTGIDVVHLPVLGPGPHAQHDSARLANWLANQPPRRERDLVGARS